MTTKKPRRASVPIGEMNGGHAFRLKLFLVTWPIFLASFLGVLGYGLLWGGWVTASIHSFEAFIEHGPRFSKTDADILEAEIKKHHREDLSDHVRDLHRN